MTEGRFSVAADSSFLGICGFEFLTSIFAYPCSSVEQCTLSEVYVIIKKTIRSILIVFLLCIFTLFFNILFGSESD